MMEVTIVGFRGRLKTLPTRRIPLYIANEQRYNTMQYRRCGKSGLRLPAISLGLWHNFGGADVFENGRAMVRRAFDLALLI